MTAPPDSHDKTRRLVLSCPPWVGQGLRTMLLRRRKKAAAPAIRTRTPPVRKPGQKAAGGSTLARPRMPPAVEAALLAAGAGPPLSTSWPRATGAAGGLAGGPARWP